MRIGLRPYQNGIRKQAAILAFYQQGRLKNARKLRRINKNTKRPSENLSDGLCHYKSVKLIPPLPIWPGCAVCPHRCRVPKRRGKTKAAREWCARWERARRRGAGADHMHAFAFVEIAIQIGKHKQFAAACAHFLHIGFHFVQQAVVGCNHHHRHVFIHQRQGAVFELAGGIGFGMNIGDFFQLQRAFECNRIVNAAAEERALAFLANFCAHAAICGSRFITCWMLPGSWRNSSV